uniref:Secreted protein n=1 Tax=Ascaris lumbricoides TaxID=6252 RepID=A0A0M3I1L4_ASCLU
MSVCDVCWDSSETYLLSCSSLDQSTRCFAPCATTNPLSSLPETYWESTKCACFHVLRKIFHERQRTVCNVALDSSSDKFEHAECASA